MVFCLVVFIAFSVACGVAQSLTQLYVRGFQDQKDVVNLKQARMQSFPRNWRRRSVYNGLCDTAGNGSSETILCICHNYFVGFCVVKSVGSDFGRVD